MRHIRYECENKRLFACGFCNKRFKQKNHLKSHIGCVHHKEEIKEKKKKIFTFTLPVL